MIIINFKNYKHGKEALELAKKIEKNLGKVVIAVSSVNLAEISDKTGLAVYAQHVVPVESDRHTGFVTVESIKKVGAKGTIINHSEHQVPLHYISETINVCKKEGLGTIVCASSLKETKKILKLKEKPLAIAFESSELIGTGKSITQYKTKELVDFINILKGTKVLAVCGAGISSVDDIKAAYNLGCEGVFISSAIANNKNVDELLKDIKGEIRK
ncbi:hypothetical protein CMI45_02535 [Candidatus Pacearchaeota archaeon]|nr:hypothetical protein [Candidatus Pacearchaeota archaeon]|tara:strand:- start:164 stop:808 length:645 start_codon:yes stop_codon:yes gene_type:complete